MHDQAFSVYQNVTNSVVSYEMPHLGVSCFQMVRLETNLHAGCTSFHVTNVSK